MMSDTAVAVQSPKKGRRKRSSGTRRVNLKQFAEGDFVVLRVSEEGENPGALLPLQPPAHFHATSKAMAWLKGGEAGQGKFVVVKFCRIVTLRPRQAVVCDVEEAPKIAVGP